MRPSWLSIYSLLVLIVYTSKETSGEPSQPSCMVEWLVAASVPHKAAILYSEALAKVQASFALLESANDHFFDLLDIRDSSHKAKIRRCARPPKCADACQINGQCLSDGRNYTCHCQPGFSGPRCEKDLCNPNPCRNSGNCSAHAETGYQCQCSPFTRGQNCDKLVDMCSPNPCKNHARCKTLAGAYQCECRPTYYGKLCEHRWISRRKYEAQVDAAKGDVGRLEQSLADMTRSWQRLTDRVSALEMELSALKQVITPQPFAGWTHYSGNNCYYKELSGNVNFFDARRNCNSSQAGADLAIIKSRAENTFVQNNVWSGFPTAAWLGASDREIEGRWRWVDGSVMSFTAWRDGEPNDRGLMRSWGPLTEDCLAIGWPEVPGFRRDIWNDVHCHLLAKPICKVCA